MQQRRTDEELFSLALRRPIDGNLIVGAGDEESRESAVTLTE